MPKLFGEEFEIFLVICFINKMGTDEETLCLKFGRNNRVLEFLLRAHKILNVVQRCLSLGWPHLPQGAARKLNPLPKPKRRDADDREDDEDARKPQENIFFADDVYHCREKTRRIVRVTVIAENMLTRTPTPKVSANPRTNPVVE